MLKKYDYASSFPSVRASPHLDRRVTWNFQEGQRGPAHFSHAGD